MHSNEESTPLGCHIIAPILYHQLKAQFLKRDFVQGLPHIK